MKRQPSTPEELRLSREAAAAELPELLERAERRRVAMQEQSVSGQLRRAIGDGGFRLAALSAAAGISIHELADFMTGDATLPLAAVDRIAAELHQQLVAVE